MLLKALKDLLNATRSEPRLARDELMVHAHHHVGFDRLLHHEMLATLVRVDEGAPVLLILTLDAHETVPKRWSQSIKSQKIH